MKKFIVSVPEIHYCEVTVEANSPQEAASKVLEGEGDYGETEYSHTFDAEEVAVTDTETKVELWYPFINH